MTTAEAIVQIREALSAGGFLNDPEWPVATALDYLGAEIDRLTEEIERLNRLCEETARAGLS